MTDIEVECIDVFCLLQICRSPAGCVRTAPARGEAAVRLPVEHAAHGVHGNLARAAVSSLVGVVLRVQAARLAHGHAPSARSLHRQSVTA